MAIASITAWLNSPDKNYPLGCALYQQYGDDAVLLALLPTGSTAYHFNKLYQGLVIVNERTDLQPRPILIGDYQPEPIRSKVSKANPDFKDAPAKIIEIRNEKNRCYAQARKLFEMIRAMDSQEHRLQAGLQILDLIDEVNEAWSIIDEWKESGNVRHQEELKQAAEVGELTEAQLIREKNNLASNICKDKKKLTACQNPRKQVKLTARLQKRTVRMEEVQRRLNEFV